MQKAKRTTITIAGIKIEVFALPDGDYVLSQRQVAQAVGKNEMSISRFLTSEGVKPLREAGLSSKQMLIDTSEQETNLVYRIKALPTQLASAYWVAQSTAGNKQAQALVYACTIESLERRIDSAMNVERSEAEYEAESKSNLEKWHEIRDFSKMAHMSFLNACALYGFNPAETHNALTRAITGKNAQQHRELPLVGQDEAIGLDHVASVEHMERIARTKLLFARYRKGNALQRLKRAVCELHLLRS